MLEDLPPLREVIRQHGLEAEKSLGQNFLLDQNVTDKIVALAGNVGKTNIIEIGPGPGGLTRSLLKAGAKVVAVDLDTRVPNVLAGLVNAAQGNLTVILADALKVNVAELVPHTPRGVVANLPYNVATPLLIGWLKQIHADPQHAFSFLHLMFQKEVAERIVAKPNTSQYGRLSVMCQWLCTVNMPYVLPPSAFTPPPKVYSAIVHFTPKQEPKNITFEKMEKVVAQAFNQKRKMLRAIFKGQDKVLLQAGIDPTARAETIDFERFERLAALF
jgi:16S rRNA (adenine1518-N6/adenine1519-N6)-dimethyltransferase